MDSSRKKDVTTRVPPHKSLLKSPSETKSHEHCWDQVTQGDLVLTQAGHEGRVLICGLRRCCTRRQGPKKSQKFRKFMINHVREEKEDWAKQEGAPGADGDGTLRFRLGNLIRGIRGISSSGWSARIHRLPLTSPDWRNRFVADGEEEGMRVRRGVGSMLGEHGVTDSRWRVRLETESSIVFYFSWTESRFRIEEAARWKFSFRHNFLRELNYLPAINSWTREVSLIRKNIGV